MRILSAQQFNHKLKVTVQQTGRMSFAPETANVLSLNCEKGIKFFMDGEPEQLYMAITTEPDSDCFPVKKSGVYYYVAAQLLFDELGVDYRTYTVIYDLARSMAYDEETGGQCYKMNYRPIKKKANDEHIE